MLNVTFINVNDAGNDPVNEAANILYIGAYLKYTGIIGVEYTFRESLYHTFPEVK